MEEEEEEGCREESERGMNTKMGVEYKMRSDDKTVWRKTIDDWARGYIGGGGKGEGGGGFELYQSDIVPLYTPAS